MIGLSLTYQTENSLSQLVIKAPIIKQKTVVSYRGQCLGPCFFLYTLMTQPTHLRNLTFIYLLMTLTFFFANKNLKNLQITINVELSKVNNWLIANKLTLNLEKSKLVLFRPPQKKFNHNFIVCLNNKALELENHVNYLGISIDRHLNWREHVKKTLAKMSRGIGVLTKIRHYVNTSILVQLYYFLIYPFLTYGVLAWGNTYITNLQKIIFSQKRAIRLTTFSGINDHSSPLFKKT